MDIDRAQVEHLPSSGAKTNLIVNKHDLMHAHVTHSKIYAYTKQ